MRVRERGDMSKLRLLIIRVMFEFRIVDFYLSLRVWMVLLVV